MDADARNLGGDGAVPLEGDRAPLLRLPHARPRLRQYRRPPDVLRHSLRQRRGAGDLRRALGRPDRPRLRDLGRDRRQERRLPRLQAECGRDAARHPQPQARRRRRGFRLREPVGRPDPARPCLARSRPAPPSPLSARRRAAAWSAALALGEAHGFRNAQVSVVAPTGTIGLVMDCDTTGIEPDFALVKFKKLAGGGYFKIINRAVPDALRALGYDERRIEDIDRLRRRPRDAGACAGRSTIPPCAPRACRRRRSTRSRRRSAAPSTSASSSTSGRSGPRP